MTDPLLERRARMARVAALGQRVGYAALLVSVGVFVWAVVAKFPTGSSAILAACMAIATLTLAPAIVLGYAVKAAQREDDERN